MNLSAGDFIGKEETKKLTELFSYLNCEFKLLQHEEVFTSEQASKIRNTPLEAGVKSMLFRTKSNPAEFVLANVPANKKVDVKKLEQISCKESLVLASHEEAIEETGCLPGSVPPLCHKKKIPLFVDEKVFENKLNSFNAGQRTVSIIIESNCLKKAFEKEKAVFCDIQK